MKKAVYMPPKRRFKFALCGNFWFYLILLLLSVVFTQALRSPLSAVLYVFMLLLPIVSAVYMLISAAGVKVSIGSGSAQTSKMTPIGFILNVSNDSVLPVPFAEIDIKLPAANRARCVERRVRVSLLPFGCYDLSEEVVFPYRGSYDIGVSDIYVYDLFRMFRIRTTADTYTSVFVMPRRLAIDKFGMHAASDVNTSSVRNRNGVDRAEMSDIRTYQNGDHMKSIHWKLSSKAQELMVKQYAMNSGNRVYIFADMAEVFDMSAVEADENFDSDINEYVADGVSELTVAATLRELDDGNDCTLVWYDGRYEHPMQIAELESSKDFDRIFPSFAAAGICSGSGEYDFTKMSALITETQGVTIIFISGRMDAELVERMTAAASMFGSLTSRGAISYYYFDPSAHIISDVKREEYGEAAGICVRQLVESAINVVEPKI